MKTNLKKLTCKELIDLSVKDRIINKILDLVSYFGINLCSLDSVEFEAEDNEDGQLISLKYNFIPSKKLSEHEREYCKPWLIKDEAGELKLNND